MGRVGRVVVFTGASVGSSTRETLEELVRAFPDQRFFVLKGNRPPKSREALWRRRFRRLRRQPVSYPLEIAWQALGALVRRRPRANGAGIGLPALEEIAEVKEVRDIHGADALAAVREFEPYLGISVGAPILKEELFKIPERGTINLHKSLLPEYRGMPPAFWELHDGAEKSGVSVHWMERSLDTGAVILQREVGIPPYATPSGLAALLDFAGTQALVETLNLVLRGENSATPQTKPETPTRSRPAYLVKKKVARQLERRRRDAKSAMRRQVKRCVLATYAYLWAPIRNRLRAMHGRCHATILLYHRVDEDRLDDVTVGVGQFAEQLELLRRRYDVLDLPEYLATRGQPRKRPVVVITFDDGYETKHGAACLLRRAKLPATFFVSTRIIDSDRPFPHDQKNGLDIPSLTWCQAEQIRSWGFHVSNHTANHADLGRLPTDKAIEEIRLAREDLYSHLGKCDALDWVAFPYGRPQNITGEVRNGLADIGVHYCFSASGGVNGIDFDPLDIRRQGVNFACDLLALRAIIEGWRPLG